MTGGRPVLAVDLGGTKTLLAMVEGAACGPSLRIATPQGGPDRWLGAVADAAEAWRGDYAAAAVAVTGLVADGCWWALNPATLPIPPGYPLIPELQRRLGVPVRALNDAQAAAWGEFRFGAGQGRDMVFVTISTGIGAGIVLGGRLLTGHRGLAGHLGPFRADAVDAPWLEHLASGKALAASGRSAEGVFAAATEAADWAERALGGVAGRIAAAFASLQALLDPDCIVVGGGVGLAPGFLARLRGELAGLPDLLRPELREAALGAEAGLLGVADFGEHERQRMGERR